MDCPDLLRIDSETYDSILARIASQAQAHRNKSKRKAERIIHHMDSPLVVVFDHADLSKREAFQVRTVDLSACGIGFLHGRLEYRDRPLIILLQDLEGQIHKLTGKVAHTRLITGKIHLIGVQLDQEINLEQFVSEQLCNRVTNAKTDDDSWTDLVKLTGTEADRLISAVERRDESGEARAKRKTSRIQYREGALSVVIHPDEPIRRACFRVVPVNLSGTGIGFLHGAFLYPGTPCDILLVNLEGKTELVRGKVARCELTKGRIHQVGVRFSNRIEVGRFSTDQPPESELQNETHAA